MAKLRATVGTDPEFMLFDDNKGRFISAIPFFKGGKWTPEHTEAGDIIHDNVLLEFATLPHSSSDAFLANIRALLRIAKARLPREIHIVAQASHTFDESELHEEDAKVFGCDPDYDGDGNQNQISEELKNGNFRSAGGHLHIGGVGKFDIACYNDKLNAVLLSDSIFGLMSAVLDCSAASLERKKLYGKAGAWRPTGYGIEYRVLSNYWLSAPELTILHLCAVNDLARATVQKVKVHEKVSPLEIRKAINTCDTQLAEQLMATLGLLSATTLRQLDIVRNKHARNQFAEVAWGLK